MLSLQVSPKTLKKTMITGGLIVFAQLVGHQAANADMKPVIQMFERSNTPYTYRPEENPDVICFEVPLKPRNRKQILCVGYEYGSYRVSTNIYEHTSSDDFPRDVMLKILKIAGKAPSVSYHLSRRSPTTNRQWAGVSLVLERDELEPVLGDTIVLIAVAGDMAEEELNGGRDTE